MQYDSDALPPKIASAMIAVAQALNRNETGTLVVSMTASPLERRIDHGIQICDENRASDSMLATTANHTRVSNGRSTTPGRIIFSRFRDSVAA
jgi:hypothetical protein